MALNGIDTQLVTVTVDAAPGGIPAGSPATLACVMTLGDYKQARNTTDYECMSSNESSTGLGSIKRDPLSFELLYNEDAADGQDVLKTAFDSNENVQVEIEFNNADTSVGETGAVGTTIDALMGVSEFIMTMPKDGKVGANFTLVFMGAATVTDMIPGSA